MVKIKCSPLLDPDNILLDILKLPDIIDMCVSRGGLCFYFYPVESWSWRFYLEKTDMSYNSLLPWACKYVFELNLPTMSIEFALF